MPIIVLPLALFWFLIVIIGCFVIWSIEKDSWGGATASTLIGAMLLWYFSGMPNPFPLLYDHWQTYVAFVVLYIVIGAVWGVAKWWFFLQNAADEYEARRGPLQAEWNGFSEDRKSRQPYVAWLQTYYGFPPSIAKHKGDFTTWMVWWPFSAIWTLLNDPLKRLYRAIYQYLAKMLSDMSTAVFKKRFDELK